LVVEEHGVSFEFIDGNVGVLRKDGVVNRGEG
jgi:hypothetical protein